MKPREKTHCKRGHPFVGPEARVSLKKRDRWHFRVCLLCQRINAKACYQRKKAA